MTDRIARAQEAYAAKLNALPRAREQLDDEQFALFEADLHKAWVELDTAWCDGLMEVE